MIMDRDARCSRDRMTYGFIRIGVGNLGKTLVGAGGGGGMITFNGAGSPCNRAVCPHTQQPVPDREGFWINHQELSLLRPRAGEDCPASRALIAGYAVLGPMRQFVLSEAVTMRELGIVGTI